MLNWLSHFYRLPFPADHSSNPELPVHAQRGLSGCIGADVEVESVLTVLPESQKSDIHRCQIVIAEGVFSICGDVSVAKPACVPARAALFKQYLHMEHASRAGGRPTDQAAKIKNSLRCLKNALVKMDPIHANWHRHAFAQLYGDDPSDSAPGSIPSATTAPLGSGT